MDFIYVSVTGLHCSQHQETEHWACVSISAVGFSSWLDLLSWTESITGEEAPSRVAEASVPFGGSGDSPEGCENSGPWVLG